MKKKETSQAALEGNGPLYTLFIVLYVLIINFLVKIWASLPFGFRLWSCGANLLFWGGVVWVVLATIAIVFIPKKCRKPWFIGFSIVAGIIIFAVFCFWKRLSDIQFVLLDCNWWGVVLPFGIIAIVLLLLLIPGKLQDSVREEFNKLLWIRDDPPKILFVCGSFLFCLLLYTGLYWIVRPDPAGFDMQEKKNFLVHLINFGNASFLTILVGMTVYFKGRGGEQKAADVIEHKPLAKDAIKCFLKKTQGPILFIGPADLQNDLEKMSGVVGKRHMITRYLEKESTEKTTLPVMVRAKLYGKKCTLLGVVREGQFEGREICGDELKGVGITF